MERPKLLFVDDDASIRQTLPLILTEEGFDVTTMATVAEAIAEISRHPYEILLSDLNIGQPGDGLTVVGAMRRIQPHARTYILTGYPDFVSALEAIGRQVDNYLTKPVDIPTLLKALRTTAGRPRMLDSPGKRASTVIRENAEAMIEKWAEETERDPHLKHLRLSRDARIDHLPAYCANLRIGWIRTLTATTSRSWRARERTVGRDASSDTPHRSLLRNHAFSTGSSPTPCRTTWLTWILVPSSPT